VGTIAELKSRSGEDGASLEDVFLELTGGPEEEEVIKFLSS